MSTSSHTQVCTQAYKFSHMCTNRYLQMHTILVYCCLETWRVSLILCQVDQYSKSRNGAVGKINLLIIFSDLQTTVLIATLPNSTGNKSHVL